jgi:hypothetical protein
MTRALAALGAFADLGAACAPWEQATAVAGSQSEMLSSRRLPTTTNKSTRLFRDASESSGPEENNHERDAVQGRTWPL